MAPSDAPADGAPLLVLVLWWEQDGAWRVRITRSVRPGEPRRTYATTRAEVLRAVEEWFDAAVTPP